MSDESNGQQRDIENYREYLRLLVQLQLDPGLQGKIDLSGVVQQTMLEAFQAQPQCEFQHSDQFAAWLRRILANNLADEIRKLRTGKRNVSRERSLEASRSRNGDYYKTPDVPRKQRKTPLDNAREFTASIAKTFRDASTTNGVASHLVAMPCDFEANLVPGIAQGMLLFDVGFGPDSSVLGHNLEKLGVDLDQVAAVAISHLHPDHMGGMVAFRSNCVRIPMELSALKGKTCYLPDEAEAEDLNGQVVQGPRVLAAGIGTTGPLARSLFFLGLCQEQTLVARIKNKGLVVITGCGHPTVEVILDMVRRLSREPLYAIAGGLHFPVTESRFQRRGIQLQMLLGTGKPPWQRISDEDLSHTIAYVNEAAPKRFFCRRTTPAIMPWND